MAPLVDLSGKRFGRLSVTRKGATKGGKAHWLCVCECGHEVIVSGDSLRAGRTKSCGCIRRENTSKMFSKHRKLHTSAYSAWQNMMSRCNNSNRRDYDNYGGRGIRVCSEWQSFIGFYADMGDCPKGHTLERLDVDGDYSKSNCEWASRKAQNRNKRNTVRITIEGTTRPLSEWAETFGANYHKMYDVIVRGKKSA